MVVPPTLLGPSRLEEQMLCWRKLKRRLILILTGK